MANAIIGAVARFAASRSKRVLLHEHDAVAIRLARDTALAVSVTVDGNVAVTLAFNVQAPAVPANPSGFAATLAAALEAAARDLREGGLQ